MTVLHESASGSVSPSLLGHFQCGRCETYFGFHPHALRGGRFTISWVCLSMQKRRGKESELNSSLHSVHPGKPKQTDHGDSVQLACEPHKHHGEPETILQKLVVTLARADRDEAASQILLQVGLHKFC